MNHSLNTNLSPEQAKFACWIEENTPYLLVLFNFEKKKFNPELVDEFLSIASSSQMIMARFALGIWLHNNEYQFDFIDAAAKLDKTRMKIVTDWLSDPFWP